MKVKQDAIHRYWREKKVGVYQRIPTALIRDEVKGYLTKKEALSETQQGEENELLNSLIDNIKAILTGEGVEVIKAKRRAGEK